MGRGVLCLTVRHRARFVVSDTGRRAIFDVPDSEAWGEVCCA